MNPLRQTTIHQAFDSVYDPRQQSKIDHPLINIIFIAVCATVCGANNWVQVSDFGQSQEEWLAQFLDLSNGIPSHDTFNNTFAVILWEHFAEGLQTWMKLITENSENNHIAIDGKVMRGSKDSQLGKNAITMVSAFASQVGLTLAQQKVGDKTNEITAIPHLLRLLDLKNCVVTIDAMGCQKDIVQQIADGDGDAIISLKGNQGRLHKDTAEMFSYFDKINFKDVAHTYGYQMSKGHGRIEKREVWAFSPHDHAPYFRTLSDWPALKQVLMVKSSRTIGDHVETATRYFLSTSPLPAQEQLRFIRSHWQIENQLHWVIDVAFREDHHRTRKGDSDANFAVLRHFALNLLRMNSAKGGIETKRLRCAWDKKFRLKVLEPILTKPFVN